MVQKIDTQKHREGSQYAVDSRLVDTEDLSVTNETLVEVEKTANQNISAGTWTTLTYDQEQKDALTEFDLSTDQFTPSESGYYLFVGSVQYQVGTDQDQLGFRVQDTTSGSPIFLTQFTASGLGDLVLPTSGIAPLVAGNVYEAQVRNNTSSDTVVGNPTNTYLGMTRVFIE